MRAYISYPSLSEAQIQPNRHIRALRDGGQAVARTLWAIGAGTQGQSLVWGLAGQINPSIFLVKPGAIAVYAAGRY